MALAEDKKALDKWDEYVKSLLRATVIDVNESEADKLKRKADLEKKGNEEKWFKYYFPNYYYAEPMPWHKAASRRAIYNSEWYEVRAWSRELAKSARTMMETIYQAMTGLKNPSC